MFGPTIVGGGVGKTGAGGATGPTGRGIDHTDVNGAGNLLVTYTDGSVVNAGHVLGATGATGAVGRGIASTDIVAGHLVVTYSDGQTATLGSIVGPQGTTGQAGATGATGAAGRGVQSSVVQGGRLLVTYTDGTQVDAGAVQGPQGVAGQTGATGATGKGIQSSVVNGAGHLILTYTDATTADVGQVVGATGSTGATGAAGRGVTGSTITGGHLIVSYSDGTNADLGQVVGATGATGATGAAGVSPWAAVAAWAANTNYTSVPPASVVTYDDGTGLQTYVAKSGVGAFTSGATFNAANWTLIASHGAAGTPATAATGAQIFAGTAGAFVDAAGLRTSGAPVALADAATIALDCAAGRVFNVTLGGNRTLANPSNQAPGQSGIIIVRQDGTGSRTLSFAANWRFAGGAPTLTTTPGAIDVIAYYVEANGSILASFQGTFQ